MNRHKHHSTAFDSKFFKETSYFNFGNKPNKVPVPNYELINRYKLYYMEKKGNEKLRKIDNKYLNLKKRISNTKNSRNILIGEGNDKNNTNIFNTIDHNSAYAINTIEQITKEIKVKRSSILPIINKQNSMIIIGGSFSRVNSIGNNSTSRNNSRNNSPSKTRNKKSNLKSRNTVNNIGSNLDNAKNTNSNLLQNTINNNNTNVNTNINANTNTNTNNSSALLVQRRSRYSINYFMPINKQEQKRRKQTNEAHHNRSTITASNNNNNNYENNINNLNSNSHTNTNTNNLRLIDCPFAMNLHSVKRNSLLFTGNLSTNNLSLNNPVLNPLENPVSKVRNIEGSNTLDLNTNFIQKNHINSKLINSYKLKEYDQKAILNPRMRLEEYLNVYHNNVNLIFKEQQDKLEKERRAKERVEEIERLRSRGKNVNIKENKEGSSNQNNTNNQNKTKNNLFKDKYRNKNSNTNKDSNTNTNNNSNQILIKNTDLIIHEEESTLLNEENNNTNNNDHNIKNCSKTKKSLIKLENQTNNNNTIDDTTENPIERNGEKKQTIKDYYSGLISCLMKETPNSKASNAITKIKKQMELYKYNDENTINNSKENYIKLSNEDKRIILHLKHLSKSKIPDFLDFRLRAIHAIKNKAVPFKKIYIQNVRDYKDILSDKLKTKERLNIKMDNNESDFNSLLNNAEIRNSKLMKSISSHTSLLREYNGLFKLG